MGHGAAREAERHFRVVHVEAPSQGRQGDSLYRTIQPCDALGQLPGVEVISGTVLCRRVHETWWDADVVVLCDVVDPDCLVVLEARKARNLPTVYEINDDFRSPQPWSQTAYLAKNLVMRSLSAQLARQSTGLQFVTPELERRYGFLNAHRCLLPNQLAELPPPRSSHRQDIAIGWGGSLGHLEDIRAVMPVIERVLSRWPQVTFRVMGPEAFRALGTGLAPSQFEYVAGGSLEDFYRFVSSIDIGLAPNLPTAFNRCRSDVKFLEYAAHGAVSVVADLEPYANSVRTGENGVRVAALEDLEHWLQRLLEQPELRARLAGEARADVEQRLESLHAPRRLQWLLANCEAAGAPRRVPTELGPGGHSRAEASAFENLLHEGLTLAAQGQRQLAASSLRLATKRCAHFYIPWLYLGRASTDPTEAQSALRTALRLEPRSVSAELLLGERLLSAGHRREAEAHFEAAHALAPAFGVPLARLAELRAGAGGSQTASALQEAASASNPFFTAPAIQRASDALAAGDAQAAQAILCRSLEHDEQQWMTHFLLGRAYLAQGRAMEAQRHCDRALEEGGNPVAVLPVLAKAHLTLGNAPLAAALLKEFAGLQAGQERPKAEAHHG